MGYEYYDHTSDIGIRVYSNDLINLISDSVEAVLNYIYPFKENKIFVNKEYLNNLDHVIFKNVLVESDSIEFLIIKIINEILYLIDIEQSIVFEFHINYLIKKGNNFLFSAVVILNKKFEKEKINEVKAATLGNIKLSKDKVSNNYMFQFVIDV